MRYYSDTEAKHVFRRGGPRNWIEAYTDSDWAGCKATRKSTSGGVVTLGGCALKSWSRMQSYVALSSAEAELYALVGTAVEALGVQALMNDMGWEPRVRIWIDSAAAKSIASRTGLGKVRHVEVKYLWIQEAVKVGRVVVAKIPGSANPADVLTKPMSYREIKNRQLLEKIGGEIIKRRWAVRWEDEE